MLLIKSPPKTTENITLQFAIPVNKSIKAPSKIAALEVSPIDPGISPTKSVQLSGILSTAYEAALEIGRASCRERVY
jgi:hypothetical protein